MERNIKASIPELYRSVDTDGVILDCNQQYADRLGYTVDEVLGTPFFDHTPEGSRNKLRDSFEEWKKTQDNTVGRILLQTKSGEEFEVMLVIESRYDDDKKLVGRNAIMREITHLEEMRKTFNVSAKEGYENPEIMHRSVNYNGIIIDTNQTYLDKLGYTKEEIIGVSLLHHTAGRSKGNISTHMENWRNGIHDTAKIWMKKKDGSEFPVSLTAVDEKTGETLIGRTVALKPLN